ncbi:MAG: hypothetical protein AAGB46_05500 [Verrucomicrobiota bacterium]
MSKLLGRIYRFFQYARNGPFRRALLDYESVFQEILADLHSKDAENSPLDIDISWNTRSNDFNAEAKRATFTRRNQVNISVNCFIDLISTANLVFSSQDLFQWIGNADDETGNFSDVLAADDRDSYTNPPKGPLRKEAANVTTEIGISLIILHEIGHIALGHTRLGPDLIGSARFRESDDDDDEIDPKKARNYHACEIDADRFSFSYALNLAAQGRSPFSKQLVTRQLQAHLFDLAVLAYVLVITFLHKADHPLEYYIAKRHPHPSVRLYASQFSFLSFLQDDDRLTAQYSAALKDSFQILNHGEYQQTTIRLITHERDTLTNLAREIESRIQKTIRANVPYYDFSSGAWLSSEP